MGVCMSSSELTLWEAAGGLLFHHAGCAEHLCHCAGPHVERGQGYGFRGLKTSRKVKVPTEY